MIKFIGEIAALGTAVCWSFSSIFFTHAGRKIGPLELNLIRLPLAILFLSLTFFLLEKDFSHLESGVIYLMLSGIVGLALGDTFLFRALVLIGARLSMLLMALAPAMAAVLAYIFLGEHISAIGVLGIFVTISGVFWVILERNSLTPHRKEQISVPGIVFGLLGALGQAAGLVFARVGLKHEMDPLLGTLVRMVSAMLVLWPVSFVLGRIRLPRLRSVFDWSAFKWVIGGVIAGPFLGVWLSLISVQHTDTGVAATLMSVVPITMLPLVIFFEKESIGWRAVSGALIAVAGIALLFLR